MKILPFITFVVLLSLVKSQGGRQRRVKEFFHGDELETNFINNRRYVEAQLPVVKIMKQMSEMHEDGSYTFGYESQDGTFRIETRSPDGMTKGKYGFRDESGTLHEIDYSAGGVFGYEPRGPGIIVPPRAPPPQPKQRPIFDYEQRRRFEDDEPIPIRRGPPPNQRPQYQRPQLQRRPPPRPIAEPVEEVFVRPQPSRRNTNAMLEYITNLQPWA